MNLEIECPSCTKPTCFDSIETFVDTESYVCFNCNSHLITMLGENMKPIVYYERDDWEY